MKETLQYFLEFTFHSFWTFIGMIILMGSVTALLKGLFSFIPRRVHFGGTQTIIEKQVKQNKDDE